MEKGSVSFAGVSKSFGKANVLQEINLKIAKGEVVVVVGPSGSGKSTLLRTINGLETIDSGELLVEGRTAMVFQAFHLFPHLSVLDNITLAPIRVQKVPQKQAEERALQLLKQVHIPEQAQKFPAQLSGGQQQRVAIARALAVQPDILLFDEPTSALDPEMVGEVLEVMKDLAKSGTTMICVTHEMAFAQEFANRVLFLNQGKIEVDTSPAVFFGEVTSPRVEEFLRRLKH